MKFYFLVCFIFFSSDIFSQNKEAIDPQFSKAKSQLEIVPFKATFNPGIYRSRLDINPTVENKFNQFGAFVQFYFPFQRSIDRVENLSKRVNDSSVYGRLFSVRPLALLHITNKGGNCAGLGLELSFRAKKRFFLNPQLSVVWVEADSNVPDGLRRGLNFHHYWHISYCVNQRVSVSAGFNHISNGNFLSSKPTSVFDMIVGGVGYTF